MPWMRGVVGVSGHLTPSNCYQKATGICSLDLISDLYVSPTIALQESELLFCPRLRQLLKTNTMPLRVTPCDCGHVQAENNPQTFCVASKIGATLSLVSQGDTSIEHCATCSDAGAIQWDIKALVKK